LKIRPVVAKFHADGRTDTLKLIVSFFGGLKFYIFWLNADKGPVAVFWIGGKKVLEVLPILCGVFFDMHVDGLYLSTFAFHNVLGNINTNRH